MDVARESPYRASSRAAVRGGKARRQHMKITRRIPLFSQLEIETKSTCNRTCDFCIRNSHPDREAVKPWFEENEMPADTVLRLMREAQAIGFRGTVCLQHYNEPLQDPRLAQFG